MDRRGGGCGRCEQINKAMGQRWQNPVIPKQHLNKSMSAFFQLMRPISSAFTSDTLLVGGSPDKGPRTRAELDSMPLSKPSLVVSVAGARVVNTERSFVFQVDSENGGPRALPPLGYELAGHEAPC